MNFPPFPDNFSLFRALFSVISDAVRNVGHPVRNKKGRENGPLRVNASDALTLRVRLTRALGEREIELWGVLFKVFSVCASPLPSTEKNCAVPPLVIACALAC